jgi:hypothetical protein
MMVVFVLRISVQILLGIFVKGGLATRGAEIISLPMILGLPLGRVRINFHFTYGIDGH